jgi:molybdate transport system substrate-binding protein
MIRLDQQERRNMWNSMAGVCIAAALWSATAMAADIKIFSAGAVEPGLVRAVDQFKRASGNNVTVQFNTAPQLAKRLADGETADILIAPPAALDEQIKSGTVSAEGRQMLGRVGAGVVVRANAPNPDIATSEALKRTLLAADSIVYNTASTGLYLDKLFERWGILEQIKAKTTRYPNGEKVMEHVIHGSGNQIGFGAITEIKLFEPKGLKLVGPLPADVQNYTSYGAALMTKGTSVDAAKAFLAFLATPAAKQLFVAAGIE